MKPGRSNILLTLLLSCILSNCQFRLDGKFLSTLNPSTLSPEVNSVLVDNTDLIEEPAHLILTDKKLWLLTTIVLITSFGVVGLLYSWHKVRMNDQLRIEKIRAEVSKKLREEIARDFHDEMGNHLAKITSYVNVLRLKPNQAEATDILEKISLSVKLLNYGTRDFIWSINPINNDIDSLFMYIKNFSENLFKATDISFEAKASNHHSLQISYKDSREAILIFKELLTNSFRHSAAGKVVFSLHEYPDAYLFSIEDDGIGFEVKSKRPTGGLSNIAFRAAKIGVDFHIESIPQRGTVATIKFLRNV